ncbi:MAG: HAMP domain-containing protein, partial [Candidatus Bathyarchaeota archaeon]|nr:HAMP domain-containing protein [Candidatus Bathyarchaeota archaeon]
MSALSLKSKLILVFALVSFIPTIALILVSYFIIAQGINRWEDMSNEMRKLRVLPMIENVRGVASDPGIIHALESKTHLAGLDIALPGGYIIALYNASGKILFSSDTDSPLYDKLISLDELGLPPVKEFPLNEPVLPKEPIKLNDKEFALSAMTSSLPEDGKVVGIVVVGKVIPSTPTDLSKMRRGIAIILAFAATIIFLIALWISSLIAREITNPIRTLVLGTREVAGGNLDYQVKVEARDEVGMLANSFNQMTEKLLSYADELKKAEKAAAWKEVAQKLAHEIKNPLTPIQLSAERLKRRYYSKREGYEEVLDECTYTIIDEVERLRRLLDEFSQFARMPTINPVPLDIHSIISDALKLYGEIPENVEIVTQFTSGIPKLMIDHDQTRRSFFNIIKNAVESMENGGKLTISTRIAKENNECVEIEFSDTGTGISAEEMEKLFTPHFSTKRGGAGLGLTIVKKIIND